MQTKTIAPALQENFIASFWTMLRENESRADDKKDTILMAWVEGWYRQWNEVTGDNKKPAWISRGENARSMERVNEIARKRGLTS